MAVELVESNLLVTLDQSRQPVRPLKWELTQSATERQWRSHSAMDETTSKGSLAGVPVSKVSGSITQLLLPQQKIVITDTTVRNLIPFHTKSKLMHFEQR